jgi:radical SAM superfamily enzyme YgiQ (UPF0313 family)
MDLDAIPFPAWDLLPERPHLQRRHRRHEAQYFESTHQPGTWPVMSLIGTRGCPYKCTYCSTPWIGQKPRYRSPHNIIAEMAQIMDKGVRMFKFQDDTYTLHKTKLRELADAIDAPSATHAFAAASIRA